MLSSAKFFALFLVAMSPATGSPIGCPIGQYNMNGIACVDCPSLLPDSQYKTGFLAKHPDCLATTTSAAATAAASTGSAGKTESTFSRVSISTKAGSFTKMPPTTNPEPSRVAALAVTLPLLLVGCGVAGLAVFMRAGLCQEIFKRRGTSNAKSQSSVAPETEEKQVKKALLEPMSGTTSTTCSQLPIIDAGLQV